MFYHKPQAFDCFIHSVGAVYWSLAQQKNIMPDLQIVYNFLILHYWVSVLQSWWWPILGRYAIDL